MAKRLTLGFHILARTLETECVLEDWYTYFTVASFHCVNRSSNAVILNYLQDVANFALMSKLKS